MYIMLLYCNGSHQTTSAWVIDEAGLSRLYSNETNGSLIYVRISE